LRTDRRGRCYLKEQDVNKGGKNMGAPKFKNVTVKGAYKKRKTEFVFDFKGYTKPDPKWKGDLTDARGGPVYGAGADIVDVLTKRGGVPFLEALGTFSALTKEIGTYLVVRDSEGKLKGMLTCVDPHALLIHHKLNHTSTVTGRLSSSDPNLQNLPRGDKSKVKQMFISRWADGRMIEADYSQLEVVVQGVLTGDKNLCRDLIARIDFHCKRVAASRDCSYEEALEWCKNEAHVKYAVWKVFRTEAKIFSFQRAYGAGAKTIAEATGMSIEDVEALIVAELEMYPEVEEYYAKVEAEINRTAVPIRAQRDNGSYGVYRRGHYTAPTGTRYSWRSYDAPAFLRKRGITDTFSPPEIRNYPVQGTGGEFVQCVLGLLIRNLIAKDFYGNGMFDPLAVLCNTVHDCVWYDCATEELSKRVWADIQPIMESIPAYYNKHHGMDITVPFPVDGEVGLNMNELGHFH
jgi:DNA polymerase-1